LAMLSEMWPSARDCAFRPRTAVVIAPKMLMAAELQKGVSADLTL
jgi:hypothetical protein